MDAGDESASGRISLISECKGGQRIDDDSAAGGALQGEYMRYSPMIKDSGLPEEFILFRFYVKP